MQLQGFRPKHTNRQVTCGKALFKVMQQYVQELNAQTQIQDMTTLRNRGIAVMRMDWKTQCFTNKMEQLAKSLPSSLLESSGN